MIDGTASISRCSMLTDMLDAPVAELTVSDNVNTCKDLINAGTLSRHESAYHVGFE